jgi:uncharacterized protein (DUF58 family)
MLSELSACLARLLAQGGNRVGAILYDNHAHRVVPPRTGRLHTLRLAHELTRPLPGLPVGVAKRSPRSRGPDQSALPANVVKRGLTTDLAAMMRLAATTARRRSLVFVISDLIGERNWDRALAMLAHRHEVVVVRVVDPVELDLPDVGVVVVEDAETGEQVLVDTSDPLLRERLAAEVGARESDLAAALGNAGVTGHRVTTDQDLAQVLIEMVRRSRLDRWRRR